VVTVNVDPKQEQEWIRQDNLAYGGLIGIGVVMVQPFLIAASLDLPAKDCVIAFSVAVHSVGYWRLERDQALTPRRAEAPADTGSGDARRLYSGG
jgi:hypothetical protein